jgi:propanol-preferring alcohol dehydrogenase
MKMKAAVLENFDAPLVIREVETPSIGPEEALIRVRACGVCGTDLKIASGKLPGVPLPHIPGHEIAGDVSAVGERVTGLQVGDRVTLHLYIPCGKCHYCRRGMESLCENLLGHVGFNRNGGLAEYVKVRASNVFPIGETMPYPEAAILTDAVATPYSALRKRAKLRKGQKLVVVGTGGLGLHAIQIAKSIGAKVVAVDIDAHHLEKAGECGADLLLNPQKEDVPEKIRKFTRRGADVIADFVGQPETLEKDLEWLAPGGKLLLVGYSPVRPLFSVSSINMVLGAKEILGCRASTLKDLAEVITWVQDKKIKPVVEDRFPLEEVNQVYERLREGKVTGRIVVEP